MADRPPIDELLLVGQFTIPHGVRGQLKFHAITNRPENLARVKIVYVGESLTPYHLQRAVEHKAATMIVSIAGVSSREQADALRGQEVYIRAVDSAPLEADEYFLHDLPGLRVLTVEGVELGVVKEVIETGANEVLVVARPEGGEALVPMIRDVVKQLDVPGGQIVIEPLPGLFE